MGLRNSSLFCARCAAFAPVSFGWSEHVWHGCTKLEGLLTEIKEIKEKYIYTGIRARVCRANAETAEAMPL
nr:MAG TPA: hypothetical protein [Caudoviricetes sp.]